MRLQAFHVPPMRGRGPARRYLPSRARNRRMDLRRLSAQDELSPPIRMEGR